MVSLITWHAASWCSHGGVVGCACCKLAHSTINGIEVLQACAFMVALLMQLACAIALVSMALLISQLALMFVVYGAAGVAGVADGACSCSWLVFLTV